MKNIVLMGAGGHAQVVLDAIALGRDYVVVGLTDVEKKPGTRVRGVPVLGSDEELPRLFEQGVRDCFVAVGGAGDPSLRVFLTERAAKAGLAFVNVIHPTAVVSPWAELDQGIFLAAGAVINAGARIGRHAIVNTNACVEHDCVLGDYVHVASGACLGGGVTVGERTLLGTGCSVSPWICIGKGSVIGAGSAVVSDIPDGVVAYGNPCRMVRENK